MIIQANRKGSLLLEALLSVVILAVSITLIIQSMTASLRATVYSADYTTALTLLENKMSELIQGGFLELGLRQQQDFQQPFDQFQYTLATDAVSQQGAENIVDVNLQVTWKKGSKSNSISLDTYLLNLPEE